MLFVSFWHLGLENFPEGTFTHRRVSADVAKHMIDEARSSGRLRGVSQDDLLAPHEEHAAENHKALCRVLGEQHGIALSIKDFVLKDEFEDDGGYTIHPLQFAEIDTTSPLMIVNCHYEMASRQEKGALKFEVSPDSITFHLFEGAAPHGDDRRKASCRIVSPASNLKRITFSRSPVRATRASLRSERRDPLVQRRRAEAATT